MQDTVYLIKTDAGEYRAKHRTLRAVRLKQVTMGDFDRVVNENSRMIYNAVFRMLGNAEDSEEVVQEVFYRAYKSFPGFKGESSVSTWLYRIMMNTVRDHIKKKKHLPPVEGDLSIEDHEAMGRLPQSGENTEKNFFRMQSMKEISAALLELPISYRTVFVLSSVEGYDSQEIAKIMGISSGTVRIRLFRAIKMLRSILKTAGMPEVMGNE